MGGNTDGEDHMMIDKGGPESKLDAIMGRIQGKDSRRAVWARKIILVAAFNVRRGNMCVWETRQEDGAVAEVGLVREQKHHYLTYLMVVWDWH